MGNHDVTLNRPYPPVEFIEEFAPYIRLTPATGVREWVIEQILSEDGGLHNPDHMHLLQADIAFLWAATAFTKQGRTVLG